MSKIDNIFKKIISDGTFCKDLEIKNPELYNNVAQGLKARDVKVCATATTLQLIDKISEEIKSDMRIRRIVGEVHLKEEDKKAIYRKIVTLLEKA